MGCQYLGFELDFREVVMDDKLEERLKDYLKELLGHYCIPGEAAEAFPSWWDQLVETVEDKEND